MTLLIELLSVIFVINKKDILGRLSGEIFMNLHVLRSLGFENFIFNKCVYTSVISITPKKITAETPNLVFYICITCKYYFINTGQIIYIQGHTYDFECIMAYGINF